MEEILTTKKARAKREKDFVITDKRMDRILKINNEIINDIVERLKAGRYKEFNWGQHHLFIIFDRYKVGKYENIVDAVSAWIANDAYGLEFDEKAIYIPEERRDELWKFLKEMKNAVNLNITYKEYNKKKDNEETQAEIKKQQEIENAKKVLEKYNKFN